MDDGGVRARETSCAGFVAAIYSLGVWRFFVERFKLLPGLKFPQHSPHFFGLLFLVFLEMAGSRCDRPLRTAGLLLRPAIRLGDLQQLWRPASHLHWRDRAMIRQSLIRLPIGPSVFWILTFSELRLLLQRFATSHHLNRF